MSAPSGRYLGTPHKIRERLSEIFFTSSVRRGDVFAIVDTARDPMIFDWLPREPGSALCLYDGPLPFSVARTAPYLVRFAGPWDKMLDDYLELAWGQSWGVFVGAAMTSLELRAHLRHFLKVQTEAGQTLLFRYYDPRVLMPFLGACNAEDRNAFFGNIDCFWVETDKGKRVAELTRGGASLGDQRIALPVATGTGAQA